MKDLVFDINAVDPDDINWFKNKRELRRYLETLTPYKISTRDARGIANIRKKYKCTYSQSIFVFLTNRLTQGFNLPKYKQL